MTWLEKVRQTLLPLSEEPDSVSKALKEWYNRHNGNTLLVGSECIKNFDIPAVDESGTLLDKKASRLKVESDRHKLITDAKERRVIQTLVQLSAEEDGFNIDSFLAYFKKRKAFTPKQLTTLIWRLNEHSIPYQKADFKMIIRRDREKEQLLQMQNWQVKQLWNSMSSSQKNFYVREKGHPP